MLIACYDVLVWHAAWFGGRGSNRCFLKTRLCGQYVLRFENLDFQNNTVALKWSKLCVWFGDHSQEIFNQINSVLPTELYRFNMNTEGRITRNSGKCNCLSEDTTFFAAPGADRVRWRLTGVSSSLVDRGDCVHAAHSKKDILVEVKNTWSFSLICTHEPWKGRSNMPQRIVFCFP